jgi:hypothetical protein
VPQDKGKILSFAGCRKMPTSREKRQGATSVVPQMLVKKELAFRPGGKSLVVATSSVSAG